MGSTTGRLTEYRRRLRVAAATVLAVRIAAAATAVGLASFVLVAWVLGPMTPLVWLCIGWGVVFGMTTAAVAWSIQPLLKLRGHGALGLVAAGQPSLLSPLQSAYELQAERAFSRELVVAQRVRVLRALDESPARKFIPWRWVVQPALAVTLLVAVIAWWSLDIDRVAAGGYAAHTSAELLFPDYMERPNERAEDADRLIVPRGTAVEYTITPIGSAARVVLELPGRHVQADRAGDQFVASFVADTDGPVEIHIESAGGERRVDHRARSIQVQVDEPPQVTIVAPQEDVVVEARQPIVLKHDATDDYGVQELTLIIKLPSGEHLRRSIWTPSEGPQFEIIGESVLHLDEFSLAPADAVTVWLEAKDGNRVDGPGIGRSAVRTLTLASEITRRRDRIVELEKLLDALLVTLAVRLEEPLPKGFREARQRRNEVVIPYNGVRSLLANVGDHRGPRTIPLLLDMKKRLERAHKREQPAYHGNAKASARERLDRAIVSELEKDVLIVADLISEARLNDAAEIAREMQQLRSELASLISELRRGQTPELQRALMAALDRADRRLEALRQQLREAMRYVPGEFVNRQSRQASQSTDALQSLREALASGDLDAAEAALNKLDQTIDAMTQALAQSEDSLVEARFGPRERALMKATDTIRDLELEQQRMADKTRRVGEKALDRAAGEQKSLASEIRGEIEKLAREVSELLGGVNDEALGPYESGLKGRAAERLDDFEKALEGGDLGEALSMADRLARAANALAKDLELSATMFRGRDGQTSDAAAQARQAAARAQDLRDAAQGAVPDVGGALTERERQQLGKQFERQGKAQEATHQLARRLREEVGGVPVSEEAAEQLEAIERPMQRAAQALGAGDPLEAHKQQEAAADQLRRLRQHLESQSKNPVGGGGKERSEGARANERVEIPTLRSKADEIAWRRRVLDAMNGAPPKGYQQAVDDYYERLLR
ncbi:MAG: DUF4175 family protein [Deltaproteobacteria bacterium]|nr:DUF4175 family protein [Deltaproteobacteria bacterium]